MNRPCALVWFRLDLRLEDNPALTAAALDHDIVPLFIYSPDEEGAAAPGAASRWWLHQSLLKLEASLRERGAKLVFRAGPSGATLLKLVKEVGARAVFWNRRYEPGLIERDRLVQRQLEDAGVAVSSFNSSLLFEPHEVATTTGTPYTVFAPFWRACLNKAPPPAPKPAPLALGVPTSWPHSLPLAAFELEPKIDWARGLRQGWLPGEAGARARLQAFAVGALSGYQEGRNQPEVDGVSRLSPHLHFGEVSVASVWHAATLAAQHQEHPPADVQTYLRELGWREFAHHLLFHFPHMVQKPLQAAFESFPWAHDDKALKAWQRARTGYPMVDAGLRQLWQTGFIHNRVRMVVASFLVKHLLLPWQSGAAWFWDTLVDADQANNTLGWQWIAGCGADAAPFFRIFNPVLQGQKFDARGAYVRQWVPELSALPDQYIHSPWLASPQVLKQAGITLGKTYPQPIVDHAFARARALAALAQNKHSAGSSGARTKSSPAKLRG